MADSAAGMPGNGIQIISLLLSGYISSRFPGMRCITMMVGNLICVGAGAALVGLPLNAIWGRLVALWLCSCQSVGFAISLTMISSNIAGYTKKQVRIFELPPTIASSYGIRSLVHFCSLAIALESKDSLPGEVHIC